MLSFVTCQLDIYKTLSGLPNPLVLGNVSIRVQPWLPSKKLGRWRACTTTSASAKVPVVQTNGHESLPDVTMLAV